MYVRELRVQDLRCLARARMGFRYPGDAAGAGLPFPNVNVLVGTNGGGKSTVLKAITLGILGPAVTKASGGRIPAGLIRRGRKRSSIRVALAHPEEEESAEHGSEGDPVSTVRIDPGREGESLRFETERPASRRPPIFLAGYGATRVSAIAHVGETPDPAGPVASLLGHSLLVPLESWLGDVEKRRRAEIVRLIDGLLPPDTRFRAKMRDHRYLLEHRGVAVPADAISEGYQSLLSWTSDLLFHLWGATEEGCPVTATPGVVLVDEIDQRLHPRWQQWLIPAIAGSFPRLQIICTSHSPLVASSLEARNLVVMEPDPDAPGDGAYRPRTIREEVSGKTIDRILQSSFFDLDSTRGDPFRKKLRDVAMRARRGDRKAALDFLRTLAGGEDS